MLRSRLRIGTKARARHSVTAVRCPAVRQLYYNGDGARWTAVDVADAVTCTGGCWRTSVDRVPRATDQEVGGSSPSERTSG